MLLKKYMKGLKFFKIIIFIDIPVPISTCDKNANHKGAEFALPDMIQWKGNLYQERVVCFHVEGKGILFI